MPRSITTSFADALARILQELAMASVAPDADLDFIDTMTQMIRERLQNPAAAPEGVAVAGAQPGFSAQQMAGNGGGAGGGAQQMSQAPTRLPVGGGPAPADMVGELQRVMQGS